MGIVSESLPEDKKTLRPDNVDYALAGIAPAFIIGMIGSLTFFLITVFYRGDYPARLMWVLGLYTFASVLIARIAIEQSRTYSMGYMIGLGAATLLVAPRFVAIQGPMGWLTLPLLVFFLVLIAFLADRITFDCTSINEADASSGIGLLQSLGLNRTDSYEKSNQLQSRPGAYLKPRKKHNPGVWVLYFALMVLPLFGVGQFFIREAASRSFSHRLLFIYLFCTLSLLVLISLLSLRKYLREREIAMETPFAIRWLSIGIASVTVLLVVFALLPIPSQSLWSWDSPLEITNRDNLQAHKMGWGNEGVNQQEAAPPQAERGEQPDAPNGDKGNRAKPQKEEDGRPGDGKPQNEKQGQQGEQGKKQGKQASQQEKQSERANGEQQKTDSRELSNASQPNESQEKESQGEPTPDPQPGKQAPANKKDGQQQQPPKQEQPQGANQPQQEQQAEHRPEQQQPKLQPEQQQPEEQQPKPPQSWDIQWNPGPMLQWLFVLILLIIAIVFGIKHRKAIMQFINSLLGRNRNSVEAGLDENEASDQELFPPFLSFQNPFASRGIPSEQIIRQMFRALQSWGYERRIVRSVEETPDEYVRRLGRRFPEQSQNLINLGALYSRIAYARGKVATQEVAPLQELWQWLVSQKSTAA